jgi:hypothetical protein
MDYEDYHGYLVKREALLCKKNYFLSRTKVVFFFSILKNKILFNFFFFF